MLSAMAAGLGFPGAKPAVERVFAGAGESQSKRAPQERKGELVTLRQEEPLAQVDQRYRAEHVNGEEKGDGRRKQPQYQGDAAEELEEGDGWTGDRRQRHPHLAERT